MTAGAAPPATSGAAPVSAGKDVYWHDSLEWGKFNLDQKPPNYTDGEYIENLGSDLLYVNGKARLAAWKKSGQPGKDDCTAAVDADGSNQTYVARGNYVCGRTAEGRTFLLTVLSTGNTLRTDTTIWNK
ncbi:hypothetical protein ABJI51_08995 [Amycolatopsis sp. NEAU-NG30]|uniref:Uncharacterized protein n=1 Tax=Amycolatopsis melonis TaxID=3156488 RepID=A0ABV0LA75_9PSEU